MQVRFIRKLLPGIVIGFCVLGVSPDAQADITITLGALKDATIFGTSAGADTGNASGKGPALFAGTDGSENIKRSELAFDVASAHIPSGATITSATLTLYLAQVSGSGGSGSGGAYPTRTLSLYGLLQDWGEGNSGSPTNPGLAGAGSGYVRQAGDSTWDYAFYDPANSSNGRWGLAGFNLHGGSFSPTLDASSTFTTFAPLNAPYTWSSAQMAADVQSWIDGSVPNFGWLLKSDNLESSPASFLAFWSKDGAAANNNAQIAPALTITYTPEPGGLLLLAFWAFIFLGNGRRRSGLRAADLVDRA